ncbi:hypothetical protein GCM10022225_51280 [Plantactinospora mayteni]|uniref:Trypsin-co-occurring domain-containing protein n=1 Tax=Plantactinospora mayteni TaxID=566021 RepID=A0ABQ4F453_9ACTN|nr:trypco2 family protein [Plantactinospora mayteni]GIH01693.1 hypothetical protein Pma05_82650 [Plantactinospora mayteni]
MIELTTVVRELRAELEAAVVAAGGEAFRFELGPIELELTVAVTNEAKGSAKVRFWVVDLGTDAGLHRVSTQRIKLTLQPRFSGSAETPWVSGEAGDRER